MERVDSCGSENAPANLVSVGSDVGLGSAAAQEWAECPVPEIFPVKIIAHS